MTPSGARTTANVVLAAAGLAAAYVVFTTPPLRRAFVRGLRLWLGMSVPAYLATQVKHAWVESGDNGHRLSAVSSELRADGRSGQLIQES